MGFVFPLIDAHCHADFFAPEQWAEVVRRSLERNVRGCISAGVWCDQFTPFLQSHAQWIVARVSSHAEFLNLFTDPNAFLVFPSIGLHPMEIAKRWRDQEGVFSLSQAQRDVEQFKKNAHENAETLWAIGETGFDASREMLSGWASKEDLLKAQEFGFAASARLAIEMGLPLIVHSRAAWKPTRDFLDHYSKLGLKCFMLHCYSGHANDLRWVESACGFAGFGGVLTWPTAHKMKAAFLEISLGICLFETDSPDLPPVLPDGSRPGKNEPGYLAAILEHASQMRRVSVSQLTELNFANLSRFLT